MAVTFETKKTTFLETISKVFKINDHKDGDSNMEFFSVSLCPFLPSNLPSFYSPYSLFLSPVPLIFLPI